MLLSQEEALCLDGCLTTSTCGTDSLAIGGVGAVASHKHTGNLGFWCTINLLQIAHLVGIEPFLENIGIGLVANSQEEAINLIISIIS